MRRLPTASPPMHPRLLPTRNPPTPSPPRNRRPARRKAPAPRQAAAQAPAAKRLTPMEPQRDSTRRAGRRPAGVGLGLRWEFLEEVLDGPQYDIGFFEV